MIEIDLDVHKVIEANRESLDEKPVAILRRMLNLPASTETPTAPAGKAWSKLGIELPQRAQSSEGDERCGDEGEIADGAWIVEGKRVNSPSGAAKAVAKTKNGKAANVDGWSEVGAPCGPVTPSIGLLFDLWAEVHRA